MKNTLTIFWRASWPLLSESNDSIKSYLALGREILLRKTGVKHA
jgi:hypothetical protein